MRMEESLQCNKDRVTIGEEFFRRIDESIRNDDSQKKIKDFIKANVQLLNGRFGKRKETPLHRYDSLNDNT